MSPPDSTEKYDSMRITISDSTNHLQQVTIHHPYVTASQANNCYIIQRNKAGLMQPQFGRWKHVSLHLGHNNHLRVCFHSDR